MASVTWFTSLPVRLRLPLGVTDGVPRQLAKRWRRLSVTGFGKDEEFGCGSAHPLQGRMPDLFDSELGYSMQPVARGQ